MPVVGLLSATKLDEREVGAVRQGLSEAGYDEGRTSGYKAYRPRSSR
jgi:hypothetical protein